MQTPTIKTIIFFILFFIISFFLIIFILINIYDQNSFLNFIENKITYYLAKGTSINVSKYEKHLIIDFDKKISSIDFKNILYYINESNPDYIFIDINFDRLKDTLFLKEIENFFSNKNNIIGVILFSNKKGLKLFKNTIDKELLDNFINIKSKYNFLFSNYLDNLRIKNIFSINSNNIGFINNNYSIFNNNNIDFLFKIENKYIFSVPFIIFTKTNNIDLNILEFEYNKINYSNKSIFYDQKGKISFSHNNIKKYNDIKNIIKSSEIENYFKIRENVINKLKSIKLFSSNLNEIELYNEENKVIDNIYNLSELKNKNENDILTEAKNEVSKWKSFKNINQEMIKNSKVFIVENENYNWISDFFYQKNIFNYGVNLIRIPIFFIIIFSIIIFLTLILINSFIKNKILILSISIFSLFLSLFLYLTLRIYFLIDFPFLIIFFIIIYSFFGGIIVKNYNNNIWIKEVRSIYKGSISYQFTKKIASFWKYKNWDLDSKQYLCSFLYIDKSMMLAKDISENDVEIIGEKNSEIESIIKSNYGIRNTFTPTEVLCYFGNPPIYKDHAQFAVNTVYKINDILINLNNENIKLRQALHAKEEWFKYIKKENQKYYTYFGNSINILSSMIQYAKLFNVSIIISETIYKLCNLNLHVRMLDRVNIVGIKGTIRLFELLTEEQYNKNKEYYNYFHAGLKLYENKKWKEAGAYFRQCLKINKEDKASKIYLDRCISLIKNKNIENWNSIYEIS